MQHTSSIVSSSSRQWVPLVSFPSNLLFTYIPSRNSSAIFSREGLLNPRIKLSLQGLTSLQVQSTLYSTTPISPEQVRSCLLFSTPCAQTDPPFPFCHEFKLSSTSHRLLSTMYQPSLIIYLVHVDYVLPGCMAAVLHSLSIQPSFLPRPVL